VANASQSQAKKPWQPASLLQQTKLTTAKFANLRRKILYQQLIDDWS